MKRLFGLAATAAFVLGAMHAQPAAAQSAGQQLAMCAAALEDQGLLTGDDRPRFVNSRGGRVKTVTVKVIDADSGEARTAQCKIRSGEVTSATIKS